jgi:hypothetical protein
MIYNVPVSKVVSDCRDLHRKSLNNYFEPILTALITLNRN